MAYWIGDEAVRAQLAAFGAKPEAIEEIMCAPVVDRAHPDCFPASI